MVERSGTGARVDGAGADFLSLDVRSVPRGRITEELVRRLREAVAEGRLAPGDALPPTRVLAGDLGVSRGVVVEVYRRLADEGLVAARTGSATRVLAGANPTPPGVPAEPGPPPPTTGVEFDLAPGVPDVAAFPRAAWLRAERTVLREATGADLGYGDPRGHPRLRGELAGWLARTRGMRVGAEDVLVVAGVAQSLALLAQVLRARGVTRIGVEDPGARGAREALAHWGLQLEPVPVDGHGARVDALARSGVEAVLLTPAHQFPTGVVLAPQRRRELLEWARGGNLVVEDDYDAEHRYDRAPVPALHASAPEHVACTGSTSKTLAPGARIGWLVAPHRLRGDLVAAKHAADLGNPALPQLVLAELIAAGDLERHVRRVRARQRARRDALLAALHRHLPAARVEGVAAGLHLLVTLPHREPGSDVELAVRAAGVGVLVHPLSWHRVRPGPPGLLLGYAATTPDALVEAVRRIAPLVTAARP
ncbi:PLP-dependent aminotransferase family protein [Paenibacillus sp. TRM 82003]|uniref:MocR-like pyridoxine biosynthesis transcription factor PdxR n=1 Tax=Kineococcus sp. TRM81007 TaxID=2925831 RepID=UPI001F5644B8|nr:PLP-dependent aminotransferase family protein [Kineococcus sp. TRM81007]MCI2237103.1 PLP-dependent aminotransferase family protein [Kineococcus sp. TRM81007]MCI3926426.1 PLP-dependent aminotransferase family protein [Paenibacillus sp. TRM 82003]